MKNREIDTKRVVYPLLAVLVTGVEYVWGLWHYGGLYRTGRLLSASSVSLENLKPMLCQHLLSIVPTLALAALVLLLLRGKTADVFGLRMKKKRGCVAVGGTAAVYLGLLIAGILRGKGTNLAILYQWVYYLVFIALNEELIFRGLCPWLMQAGELPAWCVWLIPGFLFGCMHTLMPVITQGWTGTVAVTFVSSILGYTLGAVGFYALRRWSGTLWLPVLVHGALDFAGAVIG